MYFVYSNPSVGAQIRLCNSRFARCGRKRICGPLAVRIVVLTGLEGSEGKPLLSEGKTTFSGCCSLSCLGGILNAEFCVNVALFIHIMKHCECCFTFRLNRAISQLAVFFHPDPRICAVSVEEASQTAEAAAQHAGSGHADTSWRRCRQNRRLQTGQPMVRTYLMKRRSSTKGLRSMSDTFSVFRT